MTNKFVDALDHTKWFRQVYYIPTPTKDSKDTARGSELYSEKAWEAYVAAWRDARRRDIEPQLRYLSSLEDMIHNGKIDIDGDERETVFTIYGEFDYFNRYPDLLDIRTQLCPEGRFQKYHVPVSNTALAISEIQNAIEYERENVLHNLEQIDTSIPEFTTITLVNEK